jgi:hypothetical protein
MNQAQPRLTDITFLALDTETTGLFPIMHRLVEIGLKFRPKFPGFKTRLKCVKGTPVRALPTEASPSNAT